MCILNNRSLNPFQEALCRAVPGHRGHSHCQRLPTPGRGTAAPPAGHLHQAVTQGGAQRCLGRSTWGGPAPGEGDASEEARGGALPQGKEMCLNCCQAKREEERQLGEVCWEKTKELPPGVIGCPEVPGWSSPPCYGDLKTTAHFSDGRARYSSKGQKQGFTYFTLSFFEKI